ncbi:hypothetical protein [uncultured Oxalicibacterium sp.]|uniref:hypothetical protein n=1 Tax=uncultured Oxalicibacterium sp. TaxID=1168540 RepID=UPI0025DECE1A|nr:hypothetical protein [uncultured Oxalicibacterium sp.]
MVSKSYIAAVAVLGLALTGCASQRPASTVESTALRSTAAEPVAAQGQARIVKSTNGQFEGEIVGTPAPNSKFSKVKIGMKMREVSGLIGAPDDMYRHETGKRWIPFYFGNDSQRLQTLYKGEGCLTYTGGNVFGGGENELIRVTVDASGRCMED